MTERIKDLQNDCPLEDHQIISILTFNVNGLRAMLQREALIAYVRASQPSCNSIHSHGDVQKDVEKKGGGQQSSSSSSVISPSASPALSLASSASSSSSVPRNNPNAPLSMKEFLDFLNADIICLQETKMTRKNSMLNESIAKVDGYHAFFSFSLIKDGYSGVVTYCKKNVATPLAAEEGITGVANQKDAHSSPLLRKLQPGDPIGSGIVGTHADDALDAEGRCVITDHGHFVLLNVYCPRAELDDPVRMEYKLAFYSMLQQRCDALLAEGRCVLVAGDFNVCREEIDHCNPAEYIDMRGVSHFGEHPSRKWLKSFLENSQFRDCFRVYHPRETGAYTCWRVDTGARQTNYGTRIDYIFASSNMVRFEGSLGLTLQDCYHLPHFPGSDHCPVVAHVQIYPADVKLPAVPPKMCAENLPEFGVLRQSSLLSFVRKRDATEMDNETSTLEKMPEGDILPSSILETSQSNPIHSLNSNKYGKSGKNMDSENKTDKSINQLRQSKIDFPSLVSKRKIVDEMKENGMEPYDDSVQCEANTFASTGLETFEKNDYENENAQKFARTDNDSTIAMQNVWKSLMSRRRSVPMCLHNEPCVERIVKKEASENIGRRFYVCARPQGLKTNPKARCDFFLWADK